MNKLVKQSSKPTMKPMTSLVHNNIASFCFGFAVGASFIISGQKDLNEYFPVRTEKHGHKAVLSSKNIRWIDFDKDTHCFYICTNERGCSIQSNITHDKWSACKDDEVKSYKILENVTDHTYDS